jgi:hypothetical protein
MYSLATTNIFSVDFFLGYWNVLLHPNYRLQRLIFFKHKI